MFYTEPKVDGHMPEYEKRRVEIFAAIYKLHTDYGESFTKEVLANAYKGVYGIMDNKSLQDYLK